MNEYVRDTLTQSVEMWFRGEQQEALARLRPLADAGEAAPLGVLCWFLHQMGEPGWREGVAYAKRAVTLGMPWVASYFVPNMLGTPGQREEVPELLELAFASGFTNIDPIAHAMSPFQQGDRATALRLFELAGPWPFPHAWPEQVAGAREDLRRLRGITDEAVQERERLHEALSAVASDIDAERSRVVTQAGSVLELIRQAADGAVKAEFDSEAASNRTESRTMWKWGLSVLIVAAVLAILPLVLHYAKATPLQGREVLGAHFAPTVALGALAGVLLGRSKARDRARQRARDLSVALGTMIVYSGQIDDVAERQAFTREMGRAILEAHLKAEAVSEESSNALASLLGR